MKFKFLKLAISSLVLVLATTTAHAGIIVDNNIEQGNGWVTNAWYDTEGGFFTQDTGAETEGGQSTHMNSLGAEHSKVTNSDVSQGNHTLQEGTYTISFAAGNFNNTAFPTLDIMFAGLSMNDTISSSTITPALGHWELWSFTWDIASDNTNIGNLLSFNATAPVNGISRNASFDGVGDMSDLGNGFLVDFTTSVPEPTTLAIFALGMIGLTSRRLKKQS